jgi:hypothetical protein
MFWSELISIVPSKYHFFLVLIKIPLNHRLKFNWQLVALQLYIVYLILHRKVQTVQVYIALPWLHQVASWVTCRATEPSYSRFQLLFVPIRSCLCRFQLRAGDLMTLLTEALRLSSLNASECMWTENEDNRSGLVYTVNWILSCHQHSYQTATLSYVLFTYAFAILFLARHWYVWDI